MNVVLPNRELETPNGVCAIARRWLDEFGHVALATVLFSIFCFIAAVWRQLIPGVPPPKPDVYRLPAALLLFINGILVAISAAAVAAICFGLMPVR